MNRLEKIELEEDDTLISLDVVSLFTNIPIYLAIKNIMENGKHKTTHKYLKRKTYLQFYQHLRNITINYNSQWNYRQETPSHFWI